MIIKKFFALGAVIAGTLAATAGVAAAATSHPAARPAAVAHHGTAARSGEDPSQESDGPGGHQDQDGQNVDHQFEGVE